MSVNMGENFGKSFKGMVKLSAWKNAMCGCAADVQADMTELYEICGVKLFLELCLALALLLVTVTNPFIGTVQFNGFIFASVTFTIWFLSFCAMQSQRSSALNIMCLCLMSCVFLFYIVYGVFYLIIGLFVPVYGVLGLISCVLPGWIQLSLSLAVCKWNSTHGSTATVIVAQGVIAQNVVVQQQQIQMAPV